MNKVILQGRLTKDPDVFENENMLSVNFTLAVNRSYKNKSTGQYDTDFISCQAYGGAATLIRDHLFKGNLVIIEGEWRTGSYQRQDGTTGYFNTCYVNQVHFQPGNTKGTTEPITADVPLNSRTHRAPSEPVKQEQTQMPISEPDTIPQAFDSDIDMSDEFPW